MESKVQEAEISVKALMNSILVGNSQIRLNNQQAEAITDTVMQDWQSVAQQWTKLQQSGQSIEIDRERMENEAKKILNDIVISGKKLTLEQQQQLLDAEYRDWETDRKSTRLNSSHITRSRMPSSA